ncbi:MAG: adenosylcobinamide-GDP ribazoletransferase [Brevibacillus sp.]|nr:adenosylcobinamide-GDP ribazoletransferase [Brevibacillus sp.]
MNAFFQAVSFLTRFPVPRHRFSAADWQRSVAYYPLVGAIIGLALWGFATLMPFLFSPLLTAVLTLVFWIFITGGLHLDGWMDLADGLGSSRPRDQILRIMKDSRVGAMGVLAAIGLLLIKGAAIHDLLALHLEASLLLVPAIARTNLLLAIRCWPYLREDGIGSGMRAGLNGGKLFAGYLLLVLLGWLGGGYKLLIVTLLALLYVVGFSMYVCRRLGGYTGDAYGALIESTETVSLLLILAAANWTI